MLKKRFLCNLGSSTVEKMVLEYAELFFLNKDFHCFKTLRCYINRAYKFNDANNCCHFNIYEQDKFHAHEKSFM